MQLVLYCVFFPSETTASQGLPVRVGKLGQHELHLEGAGKRHKDPLRAVLCATGQVWEVSPESFFCLLGAILCQ